MNINLNSMVRVKLTSVGLELLAVRKKEYEEIGEHYGFTPNPYSYIPDEDNSFECQIHVLFNIFGNQMEMGKDVPFVDNEIEIKYNEVKYD